MSEKITVEICCGGLADVLAAERGGADRVELNSALFLGGLTPGIGLLRAVKAGTTLPVVCMVRPREAGFRYSEADFAVAFAEAEALLQNGADGLAFGFLTESGEVDAARTERFVSFVRSLSETAELVFHRAFDVTPDRAAALETLVSLGIDRVLTSGGAPTAPEGAAEIRALVKQAEDRIEILPGGGITPENAEALLRETGARALHASVRRTVFDPSTRQNPQITFGGKLGTAALPEDEYKVTDADRVAALRRAADRAGRDRL